MRCRKNPRRKRRLAYARSGLMVNFGGSKESEYWSFPLPPISPNVTGMKSSASSMDVRALKVKVLAEELFYFIFPPNRWPPSACRPCMCMHQQCSECWIALELPVSAQPPSTSKKGAGGCFIKKLFLSVVAADQIWTFCQI